MTTLARIALVILAAGGLAACGGTPSGYPNEPTDGVGGIAWGGAPADGMVEYSGQPGALDGRMVKFEGMSGFDAGFASWYKDGREALRGLPEARVHYVFRGEALVGAVLAFDDAVKDAVVARFGEPHGSTGGPYAGDLWHGKRTTMELREGTMLFVHDTAAIAGR